MPQLRTNNTKYNDLIELKWTLLTDEEDIDGNSYEPKKPFQWQNSSKIVDSLKANLLEKLNEYSTTSTSYLSSFDDRIDYSVANQTDLLASLNQTQKNELEIYYFYKTETLTFLWILLAMILLGNFSVLIALLMSKNRKTRMNFFLMHLAIADLTVGLVNVATDIAWKTTVAFYAGNIACKVVKYSQVFVTYSSTYVLVSLSIDRYDAITHPLNFSGSWRRARILVASSWALSAIFSIPAIFLNKEAIIEGRPQCWIKLEIWQWRIYISLVAISLFFFPAVIIAACYSIIVHTIWTKSKVMTFPKSTNKSKFNKSTSESRHGRHLNNTKGSDDNENDFKRSSSRGLIPKAKIKTVKMTFVIVFVFILCWSPYFVWDLLQVYGYIPVNQTTIAISTFIQSLAPLNSAANPLIYFLFSTHFCRNISKFSFSHVFHRMCCPFQRQSRESASKCVDYNTINYSASRSSARTQRFSMTSKSSPKNSTVKKTVIIRDVKRTQVHKQNSNEPKLIDISNTVV